jgi:hypothetical protein
VARRTVSSGVTIHYQSRKIAAMTGRHAFHQSFFRRFQADGGVFWRSAPNWPHQKQIFVGKLDGELWASEKKGL